MGYIYNGKARSYTLEITQNIGGVDYTYSPPINMLGNFPGSGGAITEQEFLRLSSADFLARVQAYYAYVMLIYPNITLPDDIVIGPEIEDPNCEGVVPEPTTQEPTTEAPTTEAPTTEQPTTILVGSELTLTCSDFGVDFTNNFGIGDGISLFSAWVQLANPATEELTFTIDFYAERQDLFGTGETYGTIVVIVPEGHLYAITNQAFTVASADEDWIAVAWDITSLTSLSTTLTSYPSCGTWPSSTSEAPTTEAPTTLSYQTLTVRFAATGNEVCTEPWNTVYMAIGDLFVYGTALYWDPAMTLLVLNDGGIEYNFVVQEFGGNIFNFDGTVGTIAADTGNSCSGTTEAPTTLESTTQGDPVTTETPTTEEPTTQGDPITTEAATTEAPTTEQPTTQGDPVTTEAPTTEAPTTEEPTTEQPTTQG